MNAHRPARDPRRTFTAAELASCFACDWPAVSAVFASLPPAIAEEMARAVSAKLQEHAAITGDWTLAAEAAWHLRARHWRDAGAELAAHVDAWRAPPGRPADDRRRRLARLAVRLVKAGSPSLDIIRRLSEANATLEAPLDEQALASVAVWAAKAAGEKRHPA